MKKYKKTYKEYFDLAEDENKMCEACNNKVVVDIHHVIFKSHNGKDNIENLIGLCRVCHVEAHDNKEYNQHLKTIVKQRHLN